ncbi:MAG: succinyldiaminopimelate transaminase [Planctomycetota bacterium]|jgi:succinyldiaminopimelate transaminase
MNPRIQNLQTYPMVRLDQLKDEVLARGQRVFDFGTGDPREPTPAFIREALRDGVPTVSQYPKVVGTAAMRAAAAGYLQRRFDQELDADTEILPTQGSKEGIFHLPLVFVEPQEAERNLVVYGEPAYPVFEIGALFAEAQTHAVQLNPQNRYLLDPEVVGGEVLDRTAVVFLNYPHNPTGQLMPAALFEAWVAARERHGFVLVSDECYADIYFDEADPPHSVLEFGREGCLAMHSLSKRSGMTGYRSGFVAGDPELIAEYRRYRAGMGLAPAEFVQAAATVAWADGDHVEERRRLFAQKRAVLLELFGELGLAVYPGSATLFLWVSVPAGKTDVEYCEELLGSGVLASPGSFFGRGQEEFFRLALVPSLAECKEAASLWPR